MIGVAVSVAMLAVGAVGLFVVTRKLRARTVIHVPALAREAPKDTHAGAEDENTDIVMTGVPYEDAGPNLLEPATTRHGPFQRLRAWEVTPPGEARPGNPPVRAIQVENGPIVQLQTTDD